MAETLGPASRLFVLTGAGISAESGIPTFRGVGGLWRGHRIEEVATPEAFARDPALVWAFYSERRAGARDKEPNAGHIALARLQRALGERMVLCTQNVDGLHERAGSSDVLHMHGRLFQSRCSRPGCGAAPFDDDSAYRTREDIPRCSACGALIRPHICWFGEMPFELDRAFAALGSCDVCLVAGTSGVVEPAASFVRIARSGGARTLYVGPEEPANVTWFDDCMVGPAGALLPKLAAEWVGTTADH
jgi:NAD-dependent protein deacetylase/lipoamidase